FDGDIDGRVAEGADADNGRGAFENVRIGVKYVLNGAESLGQVRRVGDTHSKVKLAICTAAVEHFADDLEAIPDDEVDVVELPVNGRSTSNKFDDSVSLRRPPCQSRIARLDITGNARLSRRP
ncbi:MAG TPA: hypothetical protein VLZ12_00640, partial [Verrucomicrobiae bacterium]|nr:hypothetical protein [Verrucomicrobiae bacterium]